MALFLHLLGGARVDVDGQPARGRAAHRRRIAFLALLATGPDGRRSRERIISLLWSNGDSDSGRRLLSESLHVIRKEFGEATIRSVGDELVLDANLVGSDVQQFHEAISERRLADAVELYKGPFLDGWYVAGAQDFDVWAEQERAQVAASYVAALETLTVQALEARDWPTAIRYSRANVRALPDSPRATLRLARSLDGGGERAAAIKAIAAHMQYMAAEDFPIDPQVAAYADQLKATAPSQLYTVTSAPVDRASSKDVAAPVSVEPSPPPNEIESNTAHRITLHPPAPSPRRRRRTAWITVGALLVLLALRFAIPAWRTDHATTVGRERLKALDPNRIAVLYFETDSRQDVGYLADGLAEKLIEELSQVSILRVVPRTGVRPYRGLLRPPPTDSIAMALNVGTIVDGSVQRVGNRVRATVSLIDARTNTTVGTRTMELILDDRFIFDLEDRMGVEVAAFLRRQLGSEILIQARRSGTSSGRARALVLQAEHARKTASDAVAVGAAGDVESAQQWLLAADSLLSIAELTDPRWIDPVIERGWVLRDLARLSAGTAATELWTSALQNANRAVSRDSLNAKALELRGTIGWELASGRPPESSQRELAAAARDLRRALECDSTLAGAAAFLSQLLRATGTTREDLVEANTLARRAYQLDAYLAYSAEVVHQLYRSFKSLGQVDSARAWCDRGHTLSPSDWRFVECRLALMRLDLTHSSPKAAWGIVAELGEIDPPTHAAATGHPYSPVYRRLVAAAVSATAGDRDSARAVLVRALRDVSNDSELRIDIKHDETLVRLALGERQAAFVALDVYLRNRPQFAGVVLHDWAYHQFGLDSASLVNGMRSVR